MLVIKARTDVCQAPYEYVISGHAGYAELGKDIVCAAVSSLHYSFIVWLEANGIKYESNDDGKCICFSTYDNEAQKCYEMVLMGFKAISLNISIKKGRVCGLFELPANRGKTGGLNISFFNFEAY